MPTLWNRSTRNLWLLAITALGLALRLYHLNAQGVWFDEAFSVVVSGMELGPLMRELIYDVFHPPLHYLTLHGWFALTGYGQEQARVLPLIFGTLSIPLLYRLAREFASPATSLTAALLLAVSQMGVYYSQEVRPYSQAQFFSLLAACWFTAALHRGSRVSLWLSMAAGLALIYTHYYGIATLAALGLYWLIFRKSLTPPPLRLVAAGLMLMALLFLPWLIALTGTDPGHPERHVAGDTRMAFHKPHLTSPLTGAPSPEQWKAGLDRWAFICRGGTAGPDPLHHPGRIRSDARKEHRTAGSGAGNTAGLRSGGAGAGRRSSRPDLRPAALLLRRTGLLPRDRTVLGAVLYQSQLEDRVDHRRRDLVPSGAAGELFQPDQGGLPHWPGTDGEAVSAWRLLSKAA